MKNDRQVLIFAGNYREFIDYMRKYKISEQHAKNYYYISSPEKALGYKSVAIMKIGTWFTHKWIHDVLVNLEQRNKIFKKEFLNETK